MRTLTVWDAGFESPIDTFRHDQAMMLSASAGGEAALARLWQRREPALAMGRFHRLAPAGGQTSRRASGGRPVPVGPGVLAITLAVPEAGWLDRRASGLAPQQVLNRALRPLLETLRAIGVDAFYPGRDLVTVDGRAVAYASFAVGADRTVLIEQYLSLEERFANLAPLLASADPDGVAAVDVGGLDESVSLADLVRPPRRESWPLSFAQLAGRRFGCDIDVAEHMPFADGTTTLADRSAFEAFEGERGPAAPGTVGVATMTMLGVVEATARLDDGRVHDLVVSGDVIAPFATLEEIARVCEGLRLQPAALERAVSGVLSRPRQFVLGAPGLGALIARLASSGDLSSR